jgi:hypothetical protein
MICNILNKLIKIGRSTNDLSPLSLEVLVDFIHELLCNEPMLFLFNIPSVEYTDC